MLQQAGMVKWMREYLDFMKVSESESGRTII
jgi:hypothetical protein